MHKTFGCWLVTAVLFTATAASSQSIPARELLAGCLQAPTSDGLSHLAATARAQPYSDVRRGRELKTNTSVYPEPGTGRDQRTKVTVTSFLGWDLPGPGAGNLEYREMRTDIDWVDHTTGQAVTAVSASFGRACRLNAPVANARAIFELYEGLTDRPYGIRISADRQWVDVFMFDPNQCDVELSFELDKPLAGLTPSSAENRLVMPDGGARFANGVAPGIQTVTLTRSALMAGLDHTAQMSLLNQTIDPVVQWLASAREAHLPKTSAQPSP